MSKSSLIQGQVLSILGTNRVLEIKIHTKNQTPTDFDAQFEWYCGTLPLLPGWYICINGKIRKNNNVSTLKKAIKEICKSQNISTNYSIEKEVSKSDLIFLKLLEELGIEFSFHPEYFRSEQINEMKDIRKQFIVESDIDDSTLRSELIAPILRLIESIIDINEFDISNNVNYLFKLRRELKVYKEESLLKRFEGYNFIDFYREHIKRLTTLRLLKPKQELDLKKIGDLIDKINEPSIVEALNNYFNEIKSDLSKIDETKVYKLVKDITQIHWIDDVTEIYIRYPDNVSEIAPTEECPDNNHYTCPKKKSN
jgi:hypothetical protein